MNNKKIKVVSALYLQGYELKIIFGDGQVRLVDFYNFLTTNINPEIVKYLDLEKFKNFKIQDGDLMWGDYDLLFPIQELYSGKISA